jgi:hypothetical protein
LYEPESDRHPGTIPGRQGACVAKADCKTVACFGNFATRKRQLSTSKPTLIDISSAGGYGSSMTIALFAAALYYAPLS